MNRYRGFVLIAVLIFLQLISLVTLSTLSMEINSEKNIRFLRHKIVMLHTAEKLLQQLSTSQTYSASCFVPAVDDIEIRAKELSWWGSHQSCSGIVKGITYYYVMEDLGVTNCTIIVGTKNLAHFQRLTLLTSKQNFSLMLQIVIANPSTDANSCLSPAHIKEGRQSWTRLSS